MTLFEQVEDGQFRTLWIMLRRIKKYKDRIHRIELWFHVPSELATELYNTLEATHA